MATTGEVARDSAWLVSEVGLEAARAGISLRSEPASEVMLVSRRIRDGLGSEGGVVAVRLRVCFGRDALALPF